MVRIAPLVTRESPGSRYVIRIHFHRAASAEAEAAVRWYNERVPGLGDDFRAELIAAVEWIAEGLATVRLKEPSNWSSHGLRRASADAAGAGAASSGARITRGPAPVPSSSLAAS